jgi:hypothetical protein
LLFSLVENESTNSKTINIDRIEVSDSNFDPYCYTLQV